MPATRLLNAIAQRVVDLQTDKRLTFPPITRDFPEVEVENLLAQLLGEKSPSQYRDEASDLAGELRCAKGEISDLEAEISSLKREIAALEDDLQEAEER